MLGNKKIKNKNKASELDFCHNVHRYRSCAIQRNCVFCEKCMNDTSQIAVMASFENVLSSKSKTKTFRLAKFVSNAIERRNEFIRSD